MKFLLHWILACVIAFSALPLQTAQAAHGIPGSPQFGYGAWLHLNGQYFEQALKVIPDLGLDWVAIEIDWAEAAPTSESIYSSPRLKQAVRVASRNGTAVLISLTNPPDWAVTNAGPNPEATAGFILELVKQFGSGLTALELFPGANTTFAWKANPNPAAYGNLYSVVQNQLDAAGSPILLIAGGLRPLANNSPSTDWNDLDFLRGLYNANAKDWMQILSLQFSQLSGEPLKVSSSSGTHLRHYEQIRQIMLDYNHANGMLWITRINAPDGTITSSDQNMTDQTCQTEWLQQALIQVRSQLFMGVAFTHNLNPADTNLSLHGSESLVLDADNTLDPFYSVLKAIIYQTNPESGSTRPGRPKSDTPLKCKYKT